MLDVETVYMMPAYPTFTEELGAIVIATLREGQRLGSRRNWPALVAARPISGAASARILPRRGIRRCLSLATELKKSLTVSPLAAT